MIFANMFGQTVDQTCISSVGLPPFGIPNIRPIPALVAIVEPRVTVSHFDFFFFEHSSLTSGHAKVRNRKRKKSLIKSVKDQNQCRKWWPSPSYSHDKSNDLIGSFIPCLCSGRKGLSGFIRCSVDSGVLSRFILQSFIVIFLMFWRRANMCCHTII
jgi:hypothetical protein